MEPCFVTPTWSEQISGHWNNRWDHRHRLHRDDAREDESPLLHEAVRGRAGALLRKEGIHRQRACRNCRASASAAAVDAPLSSTSSGRSTCPVRRSTLLVDHASFVGYDVESNGLADVARGKLDAFLCSVAVGGKAIAEGLPLKSVGGDQYVGYLSGAVGQVFRAARCRVRRRGQCHHPPSGVQRSPAAPLPQVLPHRLRHQGQSFRRIQARTEDHLEGAEGHVSVPECAARIAGPTAAASPGR